MLASLAVAKAWHTAEAQRGLPAYAWHGRSVGQIGSLLLPPQEWILRQAALDELLWVGTVPMSARFPRKASQISTDCQPIQSKKHPRRARLGVLSIWQGMYSCLCLRLPHDVAMQEILAQEGCYSPDIA